MRACCDLEVLWKWELFCMDVVCTTNQNSCTKSFSAGAGFHMSVLYNKTPQMSVSYAFKERQYLPVIIMQCSSNNQHNLSVIWAILRKLLFFLIWESRHPMAFRLLLWVEVLVKQKGAGSLPLLSQLLPSPWRPTGSFSWSKSFLLIYILHGLEITRKSLTVSNCYLYNDRNELKN